jgi:3-oxoadipate enol-lactonase
MKPHHLLEGLPSAPALVLSNSLGTRLELWDTNVLALAERFRVIRYDHRGHGRSPAPPGPYDVEHLALDVLELLDDLEIERASFCGISLGGAIGLWLGANAPDRLDRLVVVCSAARFGEPAGWLERARTVREHGLPSISEAVLARWFTPRFEREMPELVDRFRRMLEATPREGYASCCEAIARWDFRERLEEVRVPTLVVAAADDPATPPADARAIADGIPGAVLAVVEDAAHLVNVERPTQFSALALEHLSIAAQTGRPS